MKKLLLTLLVFATANIFSGGCKIARRDRRLLECARLRLSPQESLAYVHELKSLRRRVAALQDLYSWQPHREDLKQKLASLRAQLQAKEHELVKK